jgi:hypothetical protein
MRSWGLLHSVPIGSGRGVAEDQNRSEGEIPGYRICERPHRSGCSVPRQEEGKELVMLAGVIQNHPKRSGPDLGRKFVRRLACHRSILSGVGASGKPGAVQILKPRTVMEGVDGENQAATRIKHHQRD